MECVNIVELESIEQYTTVNPDEVLAVDHTGEIGWTWNSSEWQTTTTVVTTERLIEKIRLKRDRLLRLEIDSMNPIRWQTMSQVQKNNWSMYRQHLLDVPQQPGFPTNIVWPVNPDTNQ
jgi:hypothetical protein